MYVMKIKTFPIGLAGLLYLNSHAAVFTLNTVVSGTPPDRSPVWASLIYDDSAKTLQLYHSMEGAFISSWRMIGVSYDEPVVEATGGSPSIQYSTRGGPGGKLWDIDIDFNTSSHDRFLAGDVATLTGVAIVEGFETMLHVQETRPNRSAWLGPATPVPEPESTALACVLGLAAWLGWRRMRA